MSHHLIIVESPAKVKTIKKFLGSQYDVEASGGHVRDLPKSRMGIDEENDYEPKYITIRGKGDVLANLRKKVKKADHVYLATDPDREGEAIAWHLMEALGLNEETSCRISFNEITKTAVKASLKEPRRLDQNLVDAQQTRRILDRIVGYSISPLLWKKVKRGLSAGRVQSAALFMVCQREEEINAFIPEEYWTLDAQVQVDKGRKPLTIHYSNKKALTGEEQILRLCEELREKEFSVTEIKKTEKTRKPPLPFTTSTLQQEASKNLNMSPQTTMRTAQQLYEGVDVKGSGTIGLITYLRTDSTRVAEEADRAAKEYIGKTYGEEYCVLTGGDAKAKGKIQDAHEAIRPTDVTRTPGAMKDSLTRDQFRLYQLIWKRFVASRMSEAHILTTTAKIQAGEHPFTVSDSIQTFDGFRLVYDSGEEKPEKNGAVEKMTKGSQITLQDLLPARHFTQPPAHYTEASLVKAMEEGGIGRPSTYAPTVGLLLGRRYLIKENKNLYVTELGEAVNDIMKKSFPDIVDEKFTARMESRLDQVAAGEEEWKALIRSFYPDLTREVAKAEEELEKVQIADEVTEEICEKCGRNMVIKYGPHGKFLACPGFPDCRNAKPYWEKIGVSCPNCGSDVVVRKTKKGRRYYGCEKNPECEYMTWQKPSTEGNKKN